MISGLSVPSENGPQPSPRLPWHCRHGGHDRGFQLDRGGGRAPRRPARYLEDNLMPGWSHIDRDMPTQATIDEVVRFCTGLAERGLLTPAWPVEYGGRGASEWEQTVISEELWGAGEPRGPQYMNVNWIGPAVNRLGSAEQ